MADALRTASSQAPRQVRGTLLNTIPEDAREAQYETPRTVDQLSLDTKAAAVRTQDPDTLSTSLSALSSSCSDTEWQRQTRRFDDLYDLSDEGTDLSEECPSLSSSRPASLAASSVRSSVSSTTSRNRYPSLTIPQSTGWASIDSAHKSSPVPPTPPPKIAVSPAALSRLPRFVPAVHATPSLDGSVSSDQISNLSAPATPEIHAVPDDQWDRREFLVRQDTEAAQRTEVSSDGMPSEIDVAIEGPEEDWERVLGRFPRIPGRGEDGTALVPILVDAESARAHTPSDRGVALPESAMATLRHIPLDSSPDPWSETSETNPEMWQLSAPPSRPRSADSATPASDLSGYSFTNLSIPSPGGFFASLGPRARRTWSFPSRNDPPSSATAKRFYDCPWGRDSGEVVEQVVECPARESDEQRTATQLPDGPPTAIRVPPEAQDQPVENHEPPPSPSGDAVQEIQRSDVVFEYDENYEEELRKQAVANLDRTSIWLAAQTAYLAALRETNPANEVPDETANSPDAAGRSSPEPAPAKAVRFVDAAPEAASPPPTRASKDSIYWRGFQSILKRSRLRDTFLHSNVRFDAVQSVRLGLPDRHIDALMGKYAVVRHERPPYRGPFSQAPRNSADASVLAEQAQWDTLEKEQIVLAQLRQSMWAMDALRYLNGGSLVSRPASKRLAKATTPLGRPENAGKRRVRVLDLGGHAACEWAWHLAYDYPNVKIYTVVTKQQAVNNDIKGPPNHRQVSVQHLWKLPFRDNQFDVISARSLPAFLKTERPVGEDVDEYDLCLRECYRCLKPGGYLEFFVLDAEIARAGPYASAASVEFAFNLRTRGYDPTPTKGFLARLRRAHFTGIKRAWMFLPMGVEPVKAQPPRETPDPQPPSQTHTYEAVQGPVGSTADVASMTGLLGGWMWEQWLLKLQREMGRERGGLLEGVGSVFDEGRKNGAGWTCLCGWATKQSR
ncbi:hypothetical protein M432DRAFT_621009 [Thermoascus aurantiacus ATCC 26904]